MSAANLPAPRLQLRWMPSTKDRRYQVGTLAELVVPIKEPSLRGSETTPCGPSGDGKRYFDDPYRDGAHAKWDAAVLGGLPIFVIAPDGMTFSDAMPPTDSQQEGK